MPDKPIGNCCPYCAEPMEVIRMRCQQCDVEVEAAFPGPRLGNLPIEHQRFIEMFVLASGSLKEMAAQTGVSYPTVRSRLDKVIGAVREEVTKSGAASGSASDRGDRSSMSPEEAGELIKGI